MTGHTIQRTILSAALFLIYVTAGLCATPDFNDTQIWNTYIGSTITNESKIVLSKTKETSAQWNAILLLNEPWNLSAYQGKTLYFLTSTSGDKTVRFAPNFFVIKNGVKYRVWWMKDPYTELVPPQYLTFLPDEYGIIKGSIDIPAVTDTRCGFYAQDITANMIIKITATSAPLTLQDVRTGLLTDWQYDIPGAYPNFAGTSGSVQFNEFYAGTLALEEVLPLDMASWVKDLSAKDRNVLAQEMNIIFIDTKNELRPYQHLLSREKLIAVKAYYDTHKEAFLKDPYFMGKNYILGGNSGITFKTITTPKDSSCTVNNGQLVIKNKTDRNSWTIVHIATLSDPETLKEMTGIMRLSARMTAEDVQSGVQPWQKIFIGMTVRLKDGTIIPEYTNKISIPKIGTEKDPQNYTGTFEQDVFIPENTAAVDIYLKVPGRPENEDASGVACSYLAVDQIALKKAALTPLDMNAVLASAPNKVFTQQMVGNKTYFVKAPSGLGLIAGNTPFTIENGTITFSSNKGDDYCGLYSNIFPLKNIDELELAASFRSALTKHGQPPVWAAPAIELVYFDRNGREVLAADYGEDRYPKITSDPNTNGTVSAKKFFPVPLDRGALYGQVRIHFSRQWDNARNDLDLNNYFSGTADITNIYARPALAPQDLTNSLVDTATNWAPNNGTFYKQINGQSLDWQTNRIKVIDDMTSSKRSVVFDNRDNPWSSLKTEITVPHDAIGLIGEINVDLSQITTGLENWQGFGLFLEADVEDASGHVFHFGGVPAFQKTGERYKALDRKVMPYAGPIDFYIPLKHQNLKIKKLTFQVALAGYGRATLLPINNEPNAPLIKLNMVKTSGSDTTPIFASQYALYGADSAHGRTRITFEPQYQLIARMKDTTINIPYENAESLIEHLVPYIARNLNIRTIPEQQMNTLISTVRENPSCDLKGPLSVLFNATLPYESISCIQQPGYGHTAYDLPVETVHSYALVTFDLEGSRDAEYSFRAQAINSNGDALDLPYIKQNPEMQTRWFIPFGTPDKKNGTKGYLMPLRFHGNDPIAKQFGEPVTFRVIIGSNKGQVTIQDLQVSLLQKLPVTLLNNGGKTVLRAGRTEKFLAENDIVNLSLKGVRPSLRVVMPDALELQKIARTEGDAFDNSEMAAISTTTAFKEPLNMKNTGTLALKNAALAQSVRNRTVRFKDGNWYYNTDIPFIPSGFTIVGETFHYWFTLRGQEFNGFRTNGVLPLWTSDLTEKELQDLRSVTDLREFILFYMRAQANSWQNTGVSMVRVHQLCTAWSYLTAEDLDLVIRTLALWQKEKGLLIDFDALANIDLTQPYFAGTFQDKKWTTDLSTQHDLLKATLPLPEVRDQYAVPAINMFFDTFKKYDFWPDALSYCNETGFVHGFWLLDKSNPAHHPYFLGAYSTVYQRYQKALSSDPSLRPLIRDIAAAMQLHVQCVNAERLGNELSSLAAIIQHGKNRHEAGLYGAYNVLYDGALNAYPAFRAELAAIRSGNDASWPPNGGFGWFAEAKVNADYYQKMNIQVSALKASIGTFREKVANVKRTNALRLQELVSSDRCRTAVKTLRTVMNDISANDTAVQFQYIDTFEPLSDQAAEQAFFTSFFLTATLAEDMNTVVRNAAPKDAHCVIGNNNDYIKDVFEVAGRAYLAKNEDMEWRFNKYVHHPVGGHAMNLNAGHGSVFDTDSDINYNIDLFSPMLSLGTPLRLTETNYTFVGDADSGMGNYTAALYMQEISRKTSILGFHRGLDTLEQRTLRDYFNYGNNIFKRSVFNLVNFAAHADEQLSLTLDPYDQEVMASGKRIAIIGSRISPHGTIVHPSHWRFTYTGSTQRTPITISLVNVNDKEMLVTFYGAVRNSGQKNRAGNPDLIQTFGTAPILYQYFPGELTIQLPDTFKGPVRIYAITAMNGEGEALSPADIKEKREDGKRSITIITNSSIKGAYAYRITEK